MKHPDEETIKSVRKFFGINSVHRKPIPSNSFNALVKIYSLLPDQSINPLSKFANDPDYSNIPAWRKFGDVKLSISEEQRSGEADVQHDSIPMKENADSDVSIGPAGAELQNVSLPKDTNSGGITGNMLTDDSSGVSEMLIDELGWPSNTKEVDTLASHEEGINVGTTGLHKVDEDLLDIQRILMDEADDSGLPQQPDKDVNLLANDLGSILEADMFGTEPMTVVETVGTDAEVNRSTLDGNIAVSQVQESVNRDTPNRGVFANQNLPSCPDNDQSMERMLCTEKVPQEVSEMKGRTSTVQKSENVEVSTSVCVDSSKKGNNTVANSKAKKVKQVKKTSAKDVKSGKYQHTSVDGEAYCSMKSNGDDPVGPGTKLNQNPSGLTGSSRTTQDPRSWSNCRERLQYTREQLLNLKKTTSIPDGIVKAVWEIAAEIHKKDQIYADSGTIDSSILKTKKRGSSSEARKEKKKNQRRKKRGEMNKKLGVKRLKLKPPILKPKVVQHCRHYLKGRCQEGEKCKFSHDVVPLTKSTPCCHFARQACMKGDDCPFDHQLSKYPCNSYRDIGFCSRGDGCLFSHKVLVNKGSEPTMNVSKDINMVDKLDSSKSRQQLDSSISSSGNATPKKSKENLMMQTNKPAKAPKGLSFLPLGRSQLEDSAKNKESDLSQQIGSSSGASVQRNGTEGGSSKLSKTPVDFGACQGTGKFSFDTPSVDSSGDKRQPSPLSSTRVSQIPSPVGTALVKNQPQNTSNLAGKGPADNAQRALLSTLAFASKYESGIKMSPTATKDNNKKETSRASDILQFLYGGANKEKP